MRKSNLLFFQFALFFTSLSFILFTNGQTSPSDNQHNFLISQGRIIKNTLEMIMDYERTDSEIIEDAMEIAFKYLHDLLFVKNQAYNTSDFIQTEAGNLMYGTSEQQLKEDFYLSGSDLLLIVQRDHLRSPSSKEIIAQCNPLYILPGYGPKIAELRIVLRYDGMDRYLKTKLLFQSIVGSVLNSFNDITNWVNVQTGEPHENPIINKLDIYFVQNVALLTTPNVLETARKHFNCSDLEGVLLSSDRSRVFWSPYLIKNDYLQVSNFEETKYLNKFTFAFLKDTGYFTKLNEDMLEPYTYGQNVGCSSARFKDTNFLENPECELSLSGQRFCNSEGIEWYECKSYYLNGREIKYQSEHMSCELNFLTVKNNIYQPRCLTLLSSVGNEERQEARCFRAKCKNNSLFIKRGGSEYECKTNGEIIQTSILFLQIQCPSDLEEFCSFKTCESNCLGNGYCMKGVCQCLEGKQCE